MIASDVLTPLNQRGFFHIEPGLERMRRMVRALGYPERRWPAIHVAGTNGKGSVSASLQSILQRAGYRTGLYTSPHLISLSERIQVGGRPIPDSRFAACGRRLLAMERRLHLRLSYFEFVTVVAFLYFAEEKIDIAILECGMGGRWDATNVIPKPLVSIITTIGLDHTAWLGNTLTAIAREKAGIIKEGGTTVSGVTGPGAAVIQRTAERRRNRFFSSPHDFQAIPVRSALQKPLQSWRYRARAETPVALATVLLGRHQVANAAVTLKTIQVLRQRGFAISAAAVRDGFKQVRWPGRFQRFKRAGHPTVILDGAHNPQAMATLCDALRGPEFKGRPIAFVFSAYKDKDIVSMARILGPLAKRIYLCQMEGARPATLSELAGAFRPFKRKVTLCLSGPAEAMARAWQEMPANGVVVATGSLMLVGDLLKRKRIFHG